MTDSKVRRIRWRCPICHRETLKGRVWHLVMVHGWAAPENRRALRKPLERIPNPAATPPRRGP